jgi:hypothetical protein
MELQSKILEDKKMEDERIISQADLSQISNSLGALHDDLRYIDNNVNSVKNNVGNIYSKIDAFIGEFREYALKQEKEQQKQKAEIRLVKIRQELEQKYGHYKDVRNKAKGIIQADDIGIVRKETISNLSEEVMIATPGYWLAPCLVALSAWINDQPELAEKALREGIKRNDEKTSLFFALICRRANRKKACLKWIRRYLEVQDEEHLNRETIIVLDAYSSGVLGVDSEGIISKQMDKWLAHLEEKAGFTERQIKQWSDAINLKRRPVDTSSYTYLKNYSPTWGQMQEALDDAALHSEMLAYFDSIFGKDVKSTAIKEQLDEILNNLVNDYDEEEAPLRKQERVEQLTLDCDGDLERVRKKMQIEQTAFEQSKNFTQLLTDAAMKPESSHVAVSTQKFALALSKEWILSAYNDIVAKNRMNVPNEIELNLFHFSAATVDGQNEDEVLDRFNSELDFERAKALSRNNLSSYDRASLYGGIAIFFIGIFMLAGGKNAITLGLIAAIAGIILMVNFFAKERKVEEKKKCVEGQYIDRRTKGCQIIRAVLAEVVDYRNELEKWDAESQKVVDYLERLTPSEYVCKTKDSGRRINL